MTWLVFTLLAYFLLAIAAAVDKVLLTKDIPHPVVYAFYISVLNILALVLAPWGLTWLPAYWLLVSALSGALLTYARDNDATRVVPFIAGATPIITVLFSVLVLGETFSIRQLVAFVILVVATVILSIDVGAGWKSGITKIHNLLGATLLFAISYGLSKYAFNHSPFLSVFIWSRLGSVVAGASLLLITVYRRQIIASFTHFGGGGKRRAGGLFIGGQIAGAGGVFSLNYAISLGSVSIINALQGLQQGFLLIIALVLHRFYPTMLGERLTWKTMLQKGFAVGLICVGLWMITVV
jgi:uncharacterized membrane protein